MTPLRKNHFVSVADRRACMTGFSLVELMVAMVIGLIITFAVVQIFTTSRTTYQTDEGLARVQENGRFAVEFLTREIRQAGDIGCRQAPELNLSASPLTYDNATPGASAFTGIQGYEYQGTSPGNTFVISAEEPNNVAAGWTPARNAVTATDLTLAVAAAGGGGLMPAAIPGSDALILQRMDMTLPAYAPHADQQFVYVSSALNTAGTNDRIPVGPAVISNCRRASFFVVSAVGKGAATAPDGTSLDRLEHDTSNNCKIWGAMPGSLANAPLTATAICSEIAQEYHTESGTNSGAALVGKLTTTAFYIGRGASNSPALFQSTAIWGNGSYAEPVPVELVDGVESMQILYGVDTGVDGTADTYITADNVISWQTVVSVHISLLMRSSNVTGNAADLSDDTNTYILAGPDAATGVTVDPFDDKRRRRVFNVTLQLRNRGA